MNTSELILAVSERTGLSRAQVREVVQALTQIVLEQAAAGEEVQLRGICTIGARWTDARPLRSVQDRARLTLDGRWLPRLRAASALKEATLQRSPQRWRDPRHQSAWRLAEALVSDLDLYHHAQAPTLSADTPLPMVASICAVAFGPLWERVVNTWNASVPFTIRAEGDHLLHEALRRWRPSDAHTK